jgi:hypothetical protein
MAGKPNHHLGVAPNRIDACPRLMNAKRRSGGIQAHKRPLRSVMS